MVIGGRTFDLYRGDYPHTIRLDLIIGSPNPQNKATKKLKRVLVDTGCDLTVIPLKIIKLLKLRDTKNKGKLILADDKSELIVPLYEGKITIDGVMDDNIIIGGIEDAEPLIGLDIISKWCMFLNYQDETFEIINKDKYKTPPTS